MSSSRFTAEFWICLTLGWLGAHRFMRGQIGLGLLMLFTFGGFGLWWLIDIINVYNGSFSRAAEMRNWQKSPNRCGYQNCQNARQVQFGDSCSEEHRVFAQEERIARQNVAAAQRASQSVYSTNSNSGQVLKGQKAIVCPFCQQAGGVRVTTQERGSFVRKSWSAASGGLLGEYHKVLKCSNCRQKWDMGKI